MVFKKKSVFFVLGVVVILLNLSFCSWKMDTWKRMSEDTSGKFTPGKTIPMKTVPLDKTEKIVVISDLHRGDAGRADYFTPNRALLCKILEYYNNKGFTLVMTGDVEEAWAWGFSYRYGKQHLWAESMNGLLDAYTKKEGEKELNIFDWEKLYHQENRYYRIYGNHDDYWKRLGNVKKTRLGENNIEVYPAVTFEDKQNKKMKILVIHGCQGQPLADVGDCIAPPVKVLQLNWYYLKSFFLKKGERLRYDRLNAERKKLKKQEEYMIEWAKEKNLILIAGHTHRPYSMSRPHTCILEMEVKNISTKQRALQEHLKTLEVERDMLIRGNVEDFKAKKLDIKNRETYIRQKEREIYKKKIDVDNKEIEKKFIEDEIRKTKTKNAALKRALKTKGIDDFLGNYFNTGCCFASNIITAIEVEYKDKVETGGKKGWHISLICFPCEDTDRNIIPVKKIQNVEKIRKELGKGYIEDIIK